MGADVYMLEFHHLRGAGDFALGEEEGSPRTTLVSCSTLPSRHDLVRVVSQATSAWTQSWTHAVALDGQKVVGCWRWGDDRGEAALRRLAAEPIGAERDTVRYLDPSRSEVVYGSWFGVTCGEDHDRHAQAKAWASTVLEESPEGAIAVLVEGGNGKSSRAKAAWQRDESGMLVQVVCM